MSGKGRGKKTLNLLLLLLRKACQAQQPTIEMISVVEPEHIRVRRIFSDSIVLEKNLMWTLHRYQRIDLLLDKASIRNIKPRLIKPTYWNKQW